MKRRDFIISSAGLAGVMIPALGRAAVPCPPPLVSLSGGSSASTTCEIVAPGSSYTSSFPATENPISEGGRWTNPRAAGFTKVRTENGNAFGTNGALDAYDDSYAYLSGFSPNHEIEGVIHRGNPTSTTQEVELHLRMSDDATNVRSYEILFGYITGQFQVMRWNGPMGGSFFTELTHTQGSGIGMSGRPINNGDIVKARIVGTTITVWHNGTQIWQGTDSVHATGQPGIAFFKRTTGSNSDFGFSSITARNV